MTAPELLADLDRAIAHTAPEERPRLRLALAALLVSVGAKLAEAPGPEAAVDGEPLLGAEGIAEYLGFPMEDGRQTGVEWVRCKLRDGTLPAVKLPGTKGRDGREWRSRALWLDEWIERQRLDGNPSTVLTLSHDGRGSSTAPTTPRALSTRLRAARRRPRGLGVQVGERRGSGPGANSAAHQTPCASAGEGPSVMRPEARE
jgi:hypothetical protein